MSEKIIRESKARPSGCGDAGSRGPRAKGWRALWPDRDGAAAVEFAFILPILLLLFSGIVQFGSIMFLENHMTNVARETSRRVAVGELAEAALMDVLGVFQSGNLTAAVTMRQES